MKKFFSNFEEYILVFLLFSISVLLLLQIVARYIFHSSFPWSEELVRYSFIWSTFIGIPYCIKEGASLKITQITDKLPKKLQGYLFFINKIILLIFFFILSIYSFIVTYNTFLSKQTSPALELPMWYIYLSVLFASILAIIRLIEKILHHSKHNPTSDY